MAESRTGFVSLSLGIWRMHGFAVNDRYLVAKFLPHITLVGRRRHSIEAVPIVVEPLKDLVYGVVITFFKNAKPPAML